MDFGIAGRTALVCGASKGLGYGCAEALVREGVNVVIVARGAEALEAAAKKLSALAGGSKPFVKHVAADITTPEGRAAVFALHKDYDIVVTNAGGPPPGDFRDWDREAWIKAIDANMLTPIELIKGTVDGMAARGFGRIVNITSSSVKAPIDILGLSNGARSGLTGFVAGVEGRDHQQPAARFLRHRPAQGHHGRRGEEIRPGCRSGYGEPQEEHPGPALRHAGGVRRHLRLPLQRAGRLRDGAERAGRRRGLSGDLLIHRREETQIPPTISTNATPWYQCGMSFRNAADISAANSGVRLVKNPATCGPARCTPAPQQR
jgi:NADP-dependent 3-hydroxy acid dehydrogenase YdfG